MDPRQPARQPPASSTSTAQPPTTRPRIKSKSRFSFRSDKSDKSHKRKESLNETSAEKRKTHMSNTTKANPNAAINEAQPIALALEKSTLSGLQNIKCNDVYGNPINDPDKSNPTRWRMERPLETIRSFEIAIDREYSNRQSALFQSGPGGAQSRRTSYWGGNSTPGGYDQGNRHSGGHAGYGASRDNFSDGHVPPSRGDPRFQSDPMLNKYGPPPGHVYPAVGSSRSKDTLNTGASSGSEHYHSAGAGSEDSSLERGHGVSRPTPQHTKSGYMDMPEHGEDGRGNSRYAYNGNGRGHPGYNMNGQYPAGPDPNGGPPRLPAKDSRMNSQTRVPIKLSTTQTPSGAVQPMQQENRQGWFKKRFSKGK